MKKKKFYIVFFILLAIVFFIILPLMLKEPLAFQRELVPVNSNFVRILLGSGTIFDSETGINWYVTVEAAMYEDFGEPFRPSIGTVLLVGDSSSETLQLFIENLEKIITPIDYPRDVFFWDIATESFEDPEILSLTNEIDLRYLPVLIHIHNSTILTSHSYYDGYEVYQIRQWLSLIDN